MADEKPDSSSQAEVKTETQEVPQTDPQFEVEFEPEQVELDALSQAKMATLVDEEWTPHSALRYASRALLQPIEKNLFFKLALACWYGPLVVGLFCFVIFVLTSRVLWGQLGILTIAGGFICGALGIVFIICFILVCWGRTDRPWRRVVLPGLGMFALYVSNFVVSCTLLAMLDYLDRHNLMLKLF